jgi:hypothetical protein
MLIENLEIFKLDNFRLEHYKNSGEWALKVFFLSERRLNCFKRGPFLSLAVSCTFYEQTLAQKLQKKDFKFYAWFHFFDVHLFAIGYPSQKFVFNYLLLQIKFAMPFLFALQTLC